MCKECKSKKEKVRKVFLDDLSKKGKIIDWKKSIGYNIKFIYDDIEGEVEIVDYTNNYLYIKYLDKENYKINTGNFIKCQLGSLLGTYTGNFKIEIGKIFEDSKRNIIIIDKEYRKDKKGRINKWYKYHCNKCGWDEGWMVEGGLLNGNGCSCCCPNPQIIVEGINDIPTTVPWMVKYFQGGYDEAKKYTKSSGQYIYPICQDCKKVKNNAISIHDIYQKHSISCVCGDGMSYPEKLMYSVLVQLNISFNYQYNPEWCKYNFKNKLRQGKYDFYFELNDKKYIIETDGTLGHGKKVHSKDTKTIEETLEIDKYKDRLADKQGIKMIRIDCGISDLEYIKDNILSSELNNLFHLSNIDWNKIEESALSNLCKKVCELKRDNSNLTTTQIGRIMKLGKSTIIRYLKKGTKLGWCDYNPKEESQRIARKKDKNNKEVEIFKDNISLGIFKSITKLTEKSRELFGIELNSTSSISMVCSGKYKQYKGFTFKYVN